MGIQVEFNPDLALRPRAMYASGERQEAECLPENITVGETYPFLKKDQRNYWLHGEIPLLETKGSGDLSLPLASIIITEATHVLIDGTVWTKGFYKVVDVFTDDTPRFNGFTKV